MTAPAALPDLGAYRRFVVAFSGGKDSLAASLHLLSLGVPAHAIELHHHDVDGFGPTFMDWPCTPAYVRAIAKHLGIVLYVSWREGGFASTVTLLATMGWRTPPPHWLTAWVRISAFCRQPHYGKLERRCRPKPQPCHASTSRYQASLCNIATQ